jgi:hypothetical protein
LAGGCHSSTPVAQSADEADHNRMLVRMALAENVYNGIAADGALYPKDFAHGSAALNALGERRVETLIHAYRGGSGKVVLIRGDESDDVYAKRIETIRQQFADAGFTSGQVEVGHGTSPAGTSSERGLITFEHMLSTYRTPAGGASSSGSGSTSNNQSTSFK